MICFLHVALGLHILVETPAALNFFVNPSEELQLAAPSPCAEALVRQYTLLLLCTNVIALVFLLRPVDKHCALYLVLPATRPLWEPAWVDRQFI